MVSDSDNLRTGPYSVVLVLSESVLNECNNGPKFSLSEIQMRWCMKGLSIWKQLLSFLPYAPFTAHSISCKYDLQSSANHKYGLWDFCSDISTANSQCVSINSKYSCVLTDACITRFYK